MGPESVGCFWSLRGRFCDCGLAARGDGAGLLGLPADLNDEVAAASGAEDRGVGDETAARADSLLSITQMMLLIGFAAMEGSLSTSRRISTS